MIDGVAIECDREAVVVRARLPLVTVASAVVGGGLGEARTILNVHVGRDFRCEDAERVLADLARRRAVAAPWVGLLTAAATDTAEVASETDGDLTATAVVTVGLSHPVSAGTSVAAACRPSTINTILLVDAAPEPAALVNLITTATEVKALALATAGLRAAGGAVASGTASDAVVVAATGRGPVSRFGGPVSELGAVAARAAKRALDAAVRRWLEGRP